MITRLTNSFAVLLGLSGAVLCGCSDSGAQRAASPGASPAGYHSQSDVLAHHEGATPAGAIGSDNYDEPGQLPANSGGTNGGRVGDDAR